MADNLISGSVDAAASAIEQRWADQEAEESMETEEEPEVVEETADEYAEEESDDDSEADEEVEVEAEADPEPSEEETPIETVADLAEALEVPVEELLESFRHTIKVDGETSEVTLSELTAGYQKDADYRRKTESLSKERQEFEAQRQAEIQQWQAEHHQNALMIHQFEQAIVAEMQSPQLSQLRQENETAWLARRQELQDQIDGLNRVKAEAAQRWQATDEQIKQEQMMQRQQLLQQEHELLTSKLPQWDSATEASVTEYLTNLGYTPERLQSIDNHLDLITAHKAMLYDQMQTESEVVAKKVRKAPKLQKPGARKPVTRNNLKDLKARVRKSGNVRDAAAVIEEMLS